MSRSIIEQQNIINSIIRFIKHDEGYGATNLTINTLDLDSGLIIIDKYYDIKDDEGISRRYTFNVVDDKVIHKKSETISLLDGKESIVKSEDFDIVIAQDTYVPYDVIENINNGIDLVKSQLNDCERLERTTIDLMDPNNKYIRITTRDEDDFVMNFNVNEYTTPIVPTLPSALVDKIRVTSIEPAMNEQKFTPCDNITQEALDSVRKFCATMIDADYTYTTQIIGLTSFDDYFRVSCYDCNSGLTVIFTVIFTTCGDKYTGFKVVGIEAED